MNLTQGQGGRTWQTKVSSSAQRLAGLEAGIERDERHRRRAAAGQAADHADFGHRQMIHQAAFHLERADGVRRRLDHVVARPVPETAWHRGRPDRRSDTTVDERRPVIDAFAHIGVNMDGRSARRASSPTSSACLTGVTLDGSRATTAASTPGNGVLMLPALARPGQWRWRWPRFRSATRYPGTARPRLFAPGHRLGVRLADAGGDAQLFFLVDAGQSGAIAHHRTGCWSAWYATPSPFIRECRTNDAGELSFVDHHHAAVGRGRSGHRRCW